MSADFDWEAARDAFIAENGVTRCPPQTYAIDALDPRSPRDKEVQASAARVYQRQRRFQVAKARDVAGASSAAKGPPEAAEAAEAPPSRAKPAAWCTKHLDAARAKGVEVKRRKRDARREKVAEMHAAGASRAEIAKACGVADVTVNADITALARAGRITRRDASYPQELRDRILTLAPHLTFGEIATETGLKPKQVETFLRARGMTAVLLYDRRKARALELFRQGWRAKAVAAAMGVAVAVANNMRRDLLGEGRLSDDDMRRARVTADNVDRGAIKPIAFVDEGAARRADTPLGRILVEPDGAQWRVDGPSPGISSTHPTLARALEAADVAYRGAILALFEGAQ